jgi:DegV family protein with EDD domain
MANYVISTDSTSDLPLEFTKENKVAVHSLYYRFGDDVYGGKRQMTSKDFFDRMRNGEMPTTMATNPQESKELFMEAAARGENVLHIAFSSTLSSTYQNTCLAANEVMREYDDIKIVVIDSMAASMGEGLIVYKAVEKMKEGMEFEELCRYVESILPHVAHEFTVDDLFHLYRGGRVSKATAIVGTIAGVKVNLCVNNDGALCQYTKTRGRRKSLSTLVDTMEQLQGAYRNENDVVMIVHDDTTEDAEYVASLVRERFGIQNIIMNTICQTIGAHTGTGVVGLFFMADRKL